MTATIGRPWRSQAGSTERVSVYLVPEAIAVLERLAKEYGKTPGIVARHILEAELDTIESEGRP